MRRKFIMTGRTDRSGRRRIFDAWFSSYGISRQLFCETLDSGEQGRLWINSRHTRLPVTTQLPNFGFLTNWNLNTKSNKVRIIYHCYQTHREPNSAQCYPQCPKEKDDVVVLATKGATWLFLPSLHDYSYMHTLWPELAYMYSDNRLYCPWLYGVKIDHIIYIYIYICNMSHIQSEGGMVVGV